jgi:hypothetical protein
MSNLNLKAMKKRVLVTELEKVCDLARPTLLKFTKSDLIKMYNRFSSSEPVVETEEKAGKKPRQKKQRLLDFSSDEEEEEEKKPEKKTEKKPEKKTEKVKVKEPVVEEPEPVEPDPVEPEPEEVKPVKSTKVKAKKVNEIKSEIKELLKSFKDEVSKIILEFKKSDDVDYLIDEYNQLRAEAESDVGEILDQNKSKVSESLLDYVDNLIDCQKRRVERLIE